jgi:hypothetical protein
VIVHLCDICGEEAGSYGTSVEVPLKTSNPIVGRIARDGPATTVLHLGITEGPDNFDICVECFRDALLRYLGERVPTQDFPSQWEQPPAATLDERIERLPERQLDENQCRHILLDSALMCADCRQKMPYPIDKQRYTWDKTVARYRRNE